MKQIKRIITKATLPALVLMLTKRFEVKPEPLYITISPPPKTHEQLGYLHSEVLSKLAYALHDTGEIEVNSETQAKYYLKVNMGYGSWFNFRDGVVFDPKSFEKATTEELSQAISEAIHMCEARGVSVPLPTTNNKKEGI